MANEGVMVLFYDIPMHDKDKRREYVKFRKNLKRMAYRQIQESVYIKPLKNLNCKRDELTRLEKISPLEGSLMAFSMTMSQYNNIAVLRGDGSILDNLFNPVVKF